MKRTSHFPDLATLFSTAEQAAAAADSHASVLPLKRGGITWIDIQNPTRQVLEELAGKYGLHEIHIAQCFQKGHISQVSSEKGYVFITLNFPHYVASGNRIAAGQVNIFVGKNFLLTIHAASNQLLRQMFEAYKHDEKATVSSAPELLYRVIEELLVDTAAITQNLFGELDRAESAVFDDKASDAYLIGKLRQKIIGLRRALTNQSEVLEELGGAVHAFSDGHMQRHYQTNTNVSRKLWEATEEAKEIVEVYKDVDFTARTTKTNDILSVLTLLFTLTIPATLFGTFYGMNILLPGGIETGSWTFLGEYTMLKLVTGLSVFAAFAMYAYFKRKKWF